MASPIPATAYQGGVRLRGSRLLEFWPTQGSPNHQNGNKADANSGAIHNKFILWGIWMPTWGAAGSKKAADISKHEQVQEKCEMVDPPDPHLRTFR